MVITRAVASICKGRRRICLKDIAEFVCKQLPREIQHYNQHIAHHPIYACSLLLRILFSWLCLNNAQHSACTVVVSSIQWTFSEYSPQQTQARPSPLLPGAGTFQYHFPRSVPKQAGSPCYAHERVVHERRGVTKGAAAQTYSTPHCHTPRARNSQRRHPTAPVPSPSRTIT
jgi:hypothetical protein